MDSLICITCGVNINNNDFDKPKYLTSINEFCSKRCFLEFECVKGNKYWSPPKNEFNLLEHPKLNLDLENQNLEKFVEKKDL